MLQYYYRGEEYTTRARLLTQYHIPRATLQVLLEQASTVERIQDLNKFYFHKQQVELLLDQRGVALKSAA